MPLARDMSIPIYVRPLGYMNRDADEMAEDEELAGPDPFNPECDDEATQQEN